MPLRTPSELKDYFNTGDKPTEGQFVDLIDTMSLTDQDAKNVALQAADDATAALDLVEARSPRVIAKVRWTGSSWQFIGTSFNTSGVPTGSATSLTVNFDNNFANVNYTPIITTSWTFSVAIDSNPAHNVQIGASAAAARAMDKIVITMPSAPANGYIFLVIFP